MAMFFYLTGGNLCFLPRPTPGNPAAAAHTKSLGFSIEAEKHMQENLLFLPFYLLTDKNLLGNWKGSHLVYLWWSNELQKLKRRESSLNESQLLICLS